MIPEVRFRAPANETKGTAGEEGEVKGMPRASENATGLMRL